MCISFYLLKNIHYSSSYRKEGQKKQSALKAKISSKKEIDN